MSKPYIHALSSAKKYGGEWEDYIHIHEFMDSSKITTATNIHRALTHNSYFIGMVLPAVFGETFKRKSDGKNVSTRDIGEQHVSEDFKGFIPSASDFLDQIQMQPWMMNGKGLPPSFKHTKMEEDVTYGGPKNKQPYPVQVPSPSNPFESPEWVQPGILRD
jgi:hypothetical protein